MWKLTLTHGDLHMCKEDTITNMIGRGPVLLGTLEEGHLLPAVSPYPARCQSPACHGRRYTIKGPEQYKNPAGSIQSQSQANWRRSKKTVTTSKLTQTHSILTLFKNLNHTLFNKCLRKVTCEWFLKLLLCWCMGEKYWVQSTGTGTHITHSKEVHRVWWVQTHPTDVFFGH